MPGIRRIANANWSDDELEAAVVAYRQMQQLEAELKPFVKAKYYTSLADRFPARTAKAFEFRMQNISSILHRQGQIWLKGLKPASNVGVNVEPRLIEFLIKHGVESTVTLSAFEPIIFALRDWLIAIAREGKTVTYGEVSAIFGLKLSTLSQALSAVGYRARLAGEPVLSAVVVSAKSRRCGVAFEKEFDADEEVERHRLYAYWHRRIKSLAPLPVEATFKQRQAKFVSVEVRPNQALFRRKLFEKFAGKCFVSGCDVPDALDAAHKRNRKWREGSNSTDDGYLLRKDLHALYDAGLLEIADDGGVIVNPSIFSHYGHYGVTSLAGK